MLSALLIKSLNAPKQVRKELSQQKLFVARKSLLHVHRFESSYSVQYYIKAALFDTFILFTFSFFPDINECGSHSKSKRNPNWLNYAASSLNIYGKFETCEDYNASKHIFFEVHNE